MTLESTLWLNDRQPVKVLKETSTLINHFKSEDLIFAITLVLFFFRRVSIVEKNEFQNHVFLFSNFLGAAILNNCDVSWLPFCY